MSSLADLFDGYALRARIYPAFLAALPVTSLVVLLWPHSPASSIWPLLVSVGVLFFLANWVRDNGRDAESRLYKQWGGAPTTLMLKHDNSGKQSLQRRRTKLTEVVGVELPTARSETDDWSRANDVYVTATRALIARVRAQKDSFPRVQDENTSYGFRRNLFAMKRFGLPVAIGAAVFDFVWLVAVSDGAGIVLLVLHGLVLAAWLFVVNDDWVRRQADNYAARLFETLEDPRISNKPE